MFRASLRSISGPLREHVCFSCLAQGFRGRNHALRPFYSTAISLSSNSTKQPDSELKKGSSEKPKKRRSPKPAKHDNRQEKPPSSKKKTGSDGSGKTKTPKVIAKPPRIRKSPQPRVPKNKTERKPTRTSAAIQKVTGTAPSLNSRPARPSSEPPFSVFTAAEGVKEGGSINSKDLVFMALDVERPPVPRLSFGLERVLFNPGVYQLRDPRSRVYNFDPYLGSIMPVTEFDFAALKDYITSSKDDTLRNIAIQEKKKYIGSSSSMTSALSHFHYLLSAWRAIDIRTLSQGFPDKLLTFTRLLRAPSAMFLRYQDGVYAIDADKEFDSANILMNLGKSMEKLLTLPKEDFERYRRSSENKISQEEEQAVPESYHYSTMGDFVMRSQLDAYDPRLPGTGMFDLKTRAVVSIRMDAQNFEHGVGYEIRDRHGAFESYEREFYDMIRAAFLKYSLQVRIGRMDGIFVAFHNIQRIFGFQYVSLPEMDRTLHGQSDTSLGDQEFRLSISLWNKVLDKITTRFPKQSVRLHFEARDGSNAPFMYVFAEPVTDDEIHAIQTKNQEEIDAYQRRILDLDPLESEESTSTSDDSETALSPTTNNAGQSDSVVSETKPQATSTDSSTPATNNAGQSVSVTSEQKPQTASTESSTPADESTVADVDSKPAEGSSSNNNNNNNNEKELLALHIIIRNKVNDRYVTRPSKFTDEDTWTVEYGINDIKDTSARMLYQACQVRRAKAVAGRGEDDSEVAGNVYIRKLREITKNGRDFRTNEDKKDKEEGIVVLDDVDH